MSIRNLSDDTPTIVNSLGITSMWCNIQPMLREMYVVGEKNISGVIAEKYKHDMYGLLRNMEIPDAHILPHILVNGYNSSREYDGRLTNIKILDGSRLDIYLRLYKNKKTT